MKKAHDNIEQKKAHGNKGALQENARDKNMKLKLSMYINKSIIFELMTE